ncbi:MAG TPA: GatB/YqeY domain-containing protein [Saprospiraceae bacterium]|nr:GatB/YqeY domain-containing protein [Saprospiraceae bacterium]
MSLENKLTEDLKNAMRNKDQAALRGIRAIKAAILLFKTDGSGNILDEAAEIKLVQKLVKQRQDSLEIYKNQNRADLASVEEEEINILMNYLPKQLSEIELEPILKSIIDQVGATSAKDMGKVMGLANQQLAGKADGKTISLVVKKLLG